MLASDGDLFHNNAVLNRFPFYAAPTHNFKIRKQD
jgi:hypothetical protein